MEAKIVSNIPVETFAAKSSRCHHVMMILRVVILVSMKPSLA